MLTANTLHIISSCWHQCHKPHIETQHLHTGSSEQRCTEHAASRGNASVFGRCPVRISARTPTILTQVFHSFPQSLQSYLEVRHDHFRRHLFQFIIHCHSCIQRYIIWVNDSGVKKLQTKKQCKGIFDKNYIILNEFFVIWHTPLVMKSTYCWYKLNVS
jgi:hypothetical protein